MQKLLLKTHIIFVLVGCVIITLNSCKQSKFRYHYESYLNSQTSYLSMSADSVQINPGKNNLFLQVKDKKGLPIAGADVEIISDRGKKQYKTDENGSLKIYVEEDTANVFVKAILFQPIRIDNVPFKNGKEKIMHVNLGRLNMGGKLHLHCKRKLQKEEIDSLVNDVIEQLNIHPLFLNKTCYCTLDI